MTKWPHLPTIFSSTYARLALVPMVLFVALTTTLFLANSADAAPGVNKVLSFQGRLQRSSGAVVPDGHYNIQFKIYQDGPGTAENNPGGDLKWTETYTNNNANAGVLVKNGYFSVDLGSKTAFGNSVNWNQDTLWLSMNVAGSANSCSNFTSCSPDGEMLPMKRLTATPFAINSSQLDGKTADKFTQLGQGVQTDASNGSSLFINKTGSGNHLQLQSDSTDVLTIAGNGNITMGSSSSQSISVANNTSGAGQSLTLSAGSTTNGNQNGGDLVLEAGSGSGTGSDGKIVMNSDITVGAGKSITMVGGATSLRPASPSEGTIFYDTDTKQLLTFANGKWKGSSSDSLKTIAASNSSQADKDSADIVVDGTNDQVEINSAISNLPSGGGTIVLLRGTYNVGGPIAVNKSNVTIQGQGGQSTVIKRTWNSATSLEGVVTVPSGYNHVSIQGLSIDGNKANFSSANNHGIRIGDIDSGCGSDINNVTVDNSRITNTGGAGIRFGGGSCETNKNHRITNNVISGSSVSGIQDTDGGISNTMINNNLVQNSGNNGIDVSGDGTLIDQNGIVSSGNIGIKTNSVVTNNSVTLNGSTGVEGAEKVVNNRICDNSGDGYLRQEGGVLLITGNEICGNTYDGIYASGASLNLRSVSNNDIYDNGWSGINVENGNRHVLNGNNLRDNGNGSGSGSAAINIGAADARIINNTIKDSGGESCAISILAYSINTYVSNNTFSGDGADCISDLGSATTYVNQLSPDGKLISRSNGGTSIQTSSGSDALTVNGSTGDVAVAGKLAAGSLQTTSLDRSNAGALAIAASNATSVTIGTSDGVGTTLVLDTKTSSGDPAGVNGAMYYNSDAGKFRCYQDGSWTDCVTPLPVYKEVADESLVENTAIDIEDMSFSLDANTKYHFKFVIQHTAEDGIGFGVTTPSGSTGTNWCVNEAVLAPRVASGQSSTAYCGTGDVSTTVSRTELPGTDYLSTMEGYVQTGSTAGNLKLRGKTTTLDWDGSTVKAKTFGIVEIVE